MGSDRIFGIDLGTSNIKIYKKGDGIVIDEKNLIAIENKKKIIAYGDEAYEMYEKAPDNIEIIGPVKNGVIAGFRSMQQLLTLFFNKPELKKGIGAKEFYICVPTDVTDVEKRAFYDLIASSNIKAKKIHIVEKPIADTVGADLPVNAANGILMVNIGADTTEISIISLGGIVLSKLIKVGGNRLDEAICQGVKKNYNLIIGSKTAQSLKINLASAIKQEEQTMKVMGRDLVTGLPVELAVSSNLIYESIKEYLDTIIDSIKIILERTPPELSSDIIDNGIYLTGGSSGIHELATLITKETDLSVNLFTNASQTAIEGIGKIIENEELQSLAYAMKQTIYNV